MTIRPETEADIAAIREVNEHAFDRPAEANLVVALRAGRKAIVSLVAEDAGSVIGHILFSPVTIEPDDKTLSAVGLAPMAVLPEYQNRGVGSRLVEAGLEACRGGGYDCVVVLGYANYYPKFGFIPASRYGIKSEYDVADEVFMLIELRKGALRNVSGIARYQPEFNAV